MEWCVGHLKNKNNIYFLCVGGPVFVGAFLPFLFPVFASVFTYFLFFYPIVVLIKVLANHVESDDSLFKGCCRQLVFCPAGIAYGSNLDKQKIPFVTILLIVLNGFVFWQVPQDVAGRYVFYPHGDPDFLVVIFSFVSSAFLHANFSHLLGNMFFLWAFGSVVEGRLGHLRYLGLYFFFIVTSKMLNTIFLLIRSFSESDSFFTIFQNYHSLGASGAIAGVMGIYAIRCYFSNIKVTVPFFLMPFVSLSMQVQGVVLVLIFFAMDVDSGLHHMEFSKVGHWSHLGGYLGGVIIAWWFGLHREAQVEAREHKAQSISEKYMGRLEAIDKYQELLKDDPRNIKALQYILSVTKYDDEKGAYYFVRLLECLATENFTESVRLFREYYPKYVRDVSPKLLVRLGSFFLKEFELDKAKVCLEFAVSHKGAWQPKAFMLLGETYFMIDNIALAMKAWRAVLGRFPQTPFAEEAQRKISKYTL